ncbi:MAG: FAD-dependent oxidoreductase, partial [Bacteroidia bacterium]
MADYSQKIVIAGAGVAGLAAGVYLKRKGYHDITFIEASDRVGGRMKTDKIDGYNLDRGFHVFFTAYPYAGELININ